MRSQPVTSAVGSSALPEASPRILLGRNVGLLCDEPSLPEALLAYRAAIDLGAHVSLVRPCFTELQDAKSLHDMAHLLGRLYDLLVCVALAPAVVDVLRDAADVPVVGDLDLDHLDAGREARDPPAIGTMSDGIWDAPGSDRTRLWKRALAGSLG